MYQLKQMKDKLISAIETQLNGNLEYTNTEELGEAVDMVKDLSEAIYYCTITEAMEEKSQYDQGSHYPSTHYYGDTGMMKKYPNDRYPDYRDYPIMYEGGNGRGMNGGSRYYDDTSTRYMMYRDNNYPMLSSGDDRSSMSRKRYMDAKMHNDKAAQMKELEQYTQELASDLTDMIKDATPEEKQLLQQKITMLAQKIK
jgi:hypothetical protein